MNLFQWSRFARVLRNDLLQFNLRRVGLATFGIIGAGLLIYLTNVDGLPPGSRPMAEFLFPVLLYGGGLIITGMSYRDLHDPRACFLCLTLPCSGLERFLARYLVTAPLYYLYAVAVYLALEWLAAPLCRVLLDAGFEPFAPLSPAMRAYAKGWFIAHALVYLGAIRFRSFAALRTLAVLSALWVAAVALYFVTLRIVYWDRFVSLMRMSPDTYLDLRIPYLQDLPAPLEYGIVLAGVLWVLYLAYLSLRDYEAADGL